MPSLIFYQLTQRACPTAISRHVVPHFWPCSFAIGVLLLHTVFHHCCGNLILCQDPQYNSRYIFSVLSLLISTPTKKSLILAIFSAFLSLHKESQRSCRFSFSISRLSLQIFCSFSSVSTSEIVANSSSRRVILISFWQSFLYVVPFVPTNCAFISLNILLRRPSTRSQSSLTLNPILSQRKALKICTKVQGISISKAFCRASHHSRKHSYGKWTVKIISFSGTLSLRMYSGQCLVSTRSLSLNLSKLRKYRISTAKPSDIFSLASLTAGGLDYSKPLSVSMCRYLLTNKAVDAVRIQATTTTLQQACFAAYIGTKYDIWLGIYRVVLPHECSI